MKKKKTAALLEARRLYDIGFPIIWIQANSKRPVETGWTTGERATWKHLEETYQPGMNVGTRLGRAGLITSSDGSKGYLAVIDVDVKSKDPRHRKEALEAAKKLLEGLPCPTVLSGRGGGSRHYYCLTEKPFKTFNPFESSEMVNVKMPSKAPSKKEIATLSKVELDRGIRIARAWEVSLYSEGRQVVLPPSIHPDSGNAYAWREECGIESANDIPFLELARGNVIIEEKKTGKLKSGKQEVVQDLEIDETLDVRWLPGISKEVRTLIIDGMWKNAPITDRSAYLLVAANALITAGLDKMGLLTVLTDRTTFLGECAYEHAKTDSRKRAAHWLWNYTVKKVMMERDPVAAFAGVADDEDSPPLEGESKEAQDAELAVDHAANGFYSHGPKGGLKPEYDALLREFEKTHPFKTIADMKAVYTFNGTHYVDLTPIEIKAFSENKMFPKPEEKFRMEFLNKVIANNTMRRSFFTETTEGCINFQNGVLDLNMSEKLLPHSPDYGFRGVLPYSFDSKANCPVFKKWIHSIMLDDAELVSLLQEFMGYIVRGGPYKYHKALWLGGIGRNGKSTFIDLLKALIGNGNFSVISIKALMTDKFAGADLDGKIANFSEETSPQELADSGPFKNLTGDGDLFAQKKYGDPYSFRNRAKLIMTYNTIPDLKDLSAGMLSRPIIIPFQKIIKEEEQDRDIGKKLFQELPGIFNFALKGWNRLEEQGGFTSSEKSKLALRKIREESCNVYQWVENHLVPVKANFGAEEDNGDFRYEPHQLYALYRQHERYYYKEAEFYRRMNVHPMIEAHKKRTKNGMIYFGFFVR